jgi:hypothetical protein
VGAVLTTKAVDRKQLKLFQGHLVDRRVLVPAGHERKVARGGVGGGPLCAMSREGVTTVGLVEE